ncbi:MAG: MATE family efflux transporter [Clostridium sp.]
MNTAVADTTKTTSSALKKKFIKYLLPSVAAMWVYSIYTMVDGIFVGRGVGPTALASVNIAMPFINFIFAASILFATGASTLIAINLGKKNYKAANSIFTINLFSICAFSIIIMLFTYFNLESISLALGATENTLPYVMDYLKIILFFNGFFMVSYCLEVLAKTDGFPYLSIIGVSLSAITNILLDYIFVLELDLGVKGAAYATGISQLIATIFFIVHFTRSTSNLKIIKVKYDFSILKKILSIGFPDFITELTAGVVILLFNSAILKYIGENGIVTYSVICYVSTLVLMTMIGITQGMQPLTSYYFGKREKKTIHQLLTLSFKSILIASIGIFVICVTITPFIVSAFINPNETALFDYSVRAFKIYSFSFLLVGINILISGFFASITKPAIATGISILRGFIIITLCLFTLISVFGGDSIWYATIISEAICVIISLLLIKYKYLKFKDN